MASHWIAQGGKRLFCKEWSAGKSALTPIVLLHDSLGCVELWRDFPAELATATGRRVIAYDRVGYGKSDERGIPQPITFIADEGLTTFPRVLDHFSLEKAILFGHSVGGGMAVMCAAQNPEKVAAVITEAAQSFVEPITRQGIIDVKNNFNDPNNFQRLSKYHGTKAKWVLDAWTETWLSPAMDNWSLHPHMAAVRCPLLCIHGDKDEYGSLEQPDLMHRGAGGPAEMLILECKHFPHKEVGDKVLGGVIAFLWQHAGVIDAMPA